MLFRSCEGKMTTPTNNSRHQQKDMGEAPRQSTTLENTTLPRLVEMKIEKARTKQMTIRARLDDQIETEKPVQ